jgi:single-strand DNA-binding protein
MIGNLGRDPEVKSLNNGEKVASFGVACNEHWKDKQTGERKEKTEWINVVLYGHSAAFAETYLKKGAMVYVEGKIKTRQWEKDGEKRSTTEVVVTGYGGTIQILSDKSATKSGSTGNATGAAAAPSAKRADFTDMPDDEIPF